MTQNTDLGVALNMQLFDSGDYCGKTVRITKPDGSTSDAPVVDRCGPGGTCSNQGGIDTTNQLFANLGGNIAGAALALDSTIGYGHVTVSFEILDGGEPPISLSKAALFRIHALTTRSFIRCLCRFSKPGSSRTRAQWSCRWCPECCRWGCGWSVWRQWSTAPQTVSRSVASPSLGLAK